MTALEKVRCLLEQAAIHVSEYVDEASDEDRTHALGAQSAVRLALIQVQLRLAPPTVHEKKRRRAS